MPDRRQFLLGLIATAAVVGVGTKGGIDRFAGEAGKAICVQKGDWDLAHQLLMEDAKNCLPKGTKFDIRLGLPRDFGRTNLMGWYADGKLQYEADATLESPEWNPDGGFYLFGRYTNG